VDWVSSAVSSVNSPRGVSVVHDCTRMCIIAERLRTRLVEMSHVSSLSSGVLVRPPRRSAAANTLSHAACASRTCHAGCERATLYMGVETPAPPFGRLRGFVSSRDVSRNGRRRDRQVRDRSGLGRTGGRAIKILKRNPQLDRALVDPGLECPSSPPRGHQQHGALRVAHSVLARGASPPRLWRGASAPDAMGRPAVRA